MSTVYHEVVRFNRVQRLEHWAQTISFIILSFTGVPQKFAGAGWAEWMIDVMGGIELVRIFHRVAATILILSAVSHIISVSYRIFVQRVPLTMLPRPKDALDALDVIRYNIGLARSGPRFDRFSFEEKFEYWALVWGTFVMVVTGFALWNPIFTTRFVAGDLIVAAKAAHGGEALLAVLSILTWHFYNVHFKTFNKSMFTGKMTREEMLHEHPIELLRMESAQAKRPTPREVIRRRERVFIPVASIITAFMLLFVWQIVTFEQTAITTVPQPAKVAIYVPFTPTPAPTNTPAIDPTATPLPPVMPKTTVEAGMPSFQQTILPILRANCSECHGNIAGLSMTDYDSLLKGGFSGSPIKPRDPDGSLIVQKMNAAHAAHLNNTEMQLLRAWIAVGAPEN